MGLLTQTLGPQIQQDSAGLRRGLNVSSRCKRQRPVVWGDTDPLGSNCAGRLLPGQASPRNIFFFSFVFSKYRFHTQDSRSRFKNENICTSILNTNIEANKILQDEPQVRAKATNLTSHEPRRAVWAHVFSRVQVHLMKTEAGTLSTIGWEQRGGQPLTQTRT